MKKIRFLGFAILAMIAAPSSARALDTCAIGNVIGIGGVDRGQWRITFDKLIVHDGYEACRYFIKWINTAELSSSTNLYLDELMTPGLEDCEVNSTLMLPTVLVNSPDEISRGFDRFQMRRTVQTLILCENVSGDMNGIIQWNGGFVGPLHVKFY